MADTTIAKRAKNPTTPDSMVATSAALFSLVPSPGDALVGTEALVVVVDVGVVGFNEEADDDNDADTEVDVDPATPGSSVLLIVLRGSFAPLFPALCP